MELAQPVKIPVERQTEEVWAFMSLKFHNGDKDKTKLMLLPKHFSLLVSKTL